MNGNLITLQESFRGGKASPFSQLLLVFLTLTRVYLLFFQFIIPFLFDILQSSLLNNDKMSLVLFFILIQEYSKNLNVLPSSTLS